MPNKYANDDRPSVRPTRKPKVFCEAKSFPRYSTGCTAGLQPTHHKKQKKTRESLASQKTQLRGPLYSIVRMQQTGYIQKSWDELMFFAVGCHHPFLTSTFGTCFAFCTCILVHISTFLSELYVAEICLASSAFPQEAAQEEVGTSLHGSRSFAQGPAARSFPICPA